MPGETRELNIVIRGVNRSSAAFAGIAKGADSAGTKLRTLSARAQETAYRTLGMSLAIAGFGYQAVTALSDYQSAMNRAVAVSGAAEDQIASFNRTAKDLGLTTQFSAKQAAEGMAFLAMAGQDANTVIKTIPQTLKLGGRSTDRPRFGVGYRHEHHGRLRYSGR